MKPCVKCPDFARWVVNYHPVCDTHVVEALEDELVPKDQERVSTAIPVALAKAEA